MNYNLYGNYIKNNRKKLELSQKELANILNVSEATISKWESDLIKPDLDNIISLSYIFDVKVDEFVNCRYNSNFEVEEKYKILNKISQINDEDSEEKCEFYAQELLYALESFTSLLKKKSENNLSNNENLELDRLIKDLIFTIHYEEYVEYFEDPIFGDITRNSFINSFLIPETSDEIIHLFELKKSGIVRNIEFNYRIIIEHLISKIHNKLLINKLLKYCYKKSVHKDQYYDALKCSIRYKNFDLALTCLLNGYKLDDDEKQKNLINILLNHFDN